MCEPPAITDGVPDGNGHPYVSLMVAQNADGQPLWRCSGTMMSSTVFLTAGHCTEAPAAHAEIWFAPGPINNDPNYTSVAAGATGCDNPAVTGYPCDGDAGGTRRRIRATTRTLSFLFDLGVAVLDAPFQRDTYGVLPQLNQLDTLKTQRASRTSPSRLWATASS